MSLTTPLVRLRILPALLPVDGVNADIRVSPDGFYLQKKVGLGAWENFIEVADLKGPIGPGTEFRSNGSYIQWRPEGAGESAWVDLFPLSSIGGGGGGGMPIASQAEAEAGTANDRTMTPLRTAQAIAARGGSGGASGDATTFGGQPPAFYRNAGNLNAGTVPAAQMPTATSSARGGVILSSSTTSSSGVTSGQAATPAAVKIVADALAQKADRATSLAGYGIADAFTKDETVTTARSAVDSQRGATNGIAPLGPDNLIPAQYGRPEWVGGGSGGSPYPYTPEDAAQKGQPNGYASLDGNGRLLPSAQGFFPRPNIFVPLHQRLGSEVYLTDGYVEGSNLTDFSDLIAANLAQAVAQRRPFIIPQGLFLAKRQFVANDTGIMMSGMGKTLSAIQWTADAASSGFRFSASDNIAKPDFMHFRDFALYTEQEAQGEAIFATFEKQIRPNNGNPVVLNRYSTRFRAQDVTIQGAQGSLGQGAKSSMGWLKGITCMYEIDAILRDVQFEGAINGTEPNYMSEWAFYIGGPDGYGHPTGPFIDTCNVFHAKRAVIFEGNEGGVVTNSQLVGVLVGVDFVDNAGRPLLMCTNNHINAFKACIRADAASQIQIIGNSLYHTIGAPEDGIGVSIAGTRARSQHAIITGNVFESGIATNSVFTGITIFNCDHGVIDGNTFRPGRVSPDPSNMRGIVLSANARFFKVGDNNVFENPLSGRPEVLSEVNDGGVENIVPGYSARYRKSANQSLAAGSETTVTFNTLAEQIGNSATSPNTNPWVAPTDGTFEIIFRCHFQSGSQASSRSISLRRTSTSGDIIGFASGETVNSSTAQNLTALARVRLRKGEFIYPRAISGFAASIAGGDGRTEFYWARVAD